MAIAVFFQPSVGWVGDVIPFEENGDLWLFYLQELRASPKPGTSWALVRTHDLVTFEDVGVVLPHGGLDQRDFNVYTGSVVLDADGTHHVFYTGQNPERLGADGLPLQLVMHATSTDGMRSWTKHPEHTFGAGAGYESGDWRDPFVFWDERASRWRMILTGRRDSGPARRRGVIAQRTSTDLRTWEPATPFWDPRRYVALECPEVFSIGDWYYLVYSEFSDAFVTRYRMSRSLDGPWIAPEFDSLDGRAFYAAKSVEVCGRRIFAGWISSREGNTDDGAWQWAGTLSLIEASPNPDGTLAFALPEAVLASFTDDLATGLDVSAVDAVDGYGHAVGTQTLPAQCYVRAELEIDPGTAECGLLLRTSDDGDRGYVVRLEPRRNRIVLDRWPRPQTGPAQWQISGDVPHWLELERPADLSGSSHTLELLLDGDLAVIVLDRQVCLSTRLYDHRDGKIGVFAADGATKLRELVVRQRPTQRPDPRSDQA